MVERAHGGGVAQGVAARDVKLPAVTRRPALWAGCYVLWLAVLYGLSSLNSVSGPEISHIDKVEHALYFTAGSVALGLALTLRPGGLSRRRPLVLGAVLVAAALAVGLADEWHQSHVPGRQGNDLGDLIADVTGGLLGALVLPLARTWLTRTAGGETG